MRTRICLCLAMTALGGCQAMRTQGPAAPRVDQESGSVLPLRSVRLFENGVGYFEREGTLDAAAASLPVPASHVDDALKTLLVLSRGGAKVSGVEFASVVSAGAARALAGLPGDEERPLSYANVLESMRGFRVRIDAPNGAHSGRLLDVERFAVPYPNQKTNGGGASAQKKDDAGSVTEIATREDFWLVLSEDDGAIVRFKASEVERVQPTDPDFTARLQTAVDALSGRSAQLRRSLRVLASASTPVRIGYLAETPVWRSSYRLVLAEGDERAQLQGWALVHNDTDEAWDAVEVELVNGAPDSFLFPLAAPRYVRRALAAPEEELSTLPQLALQTPDAIWGDHLGEGGIALSGIGFGGGGVGEGYGTGSGRIGTIGDRTRTSASRDIKLGDLAEVKGAETEDEGLLFSYRLSDPISLRAHGSALLPFLSKPVGAKRLTQFGEGTEARAVVRFVNGTPYTLPAGPVALFEAAGFSGETALARITPGERAFLEYGRDLDMELTDLDEFELSRETQKVVYESERLVEHYVRVTEKGFTLVNRGGRPRTVAYALTGVVRNATVTGADEMDYDAARGRALALVDVPAGKTEPAHLTVTEALETSYPSSKLTPEVLERLSAAAALPEAARAALRAAMPHAAAAAARQKELEELGEDKGEIEGDLERAKGYLEAGSGPRAPGDPIAARIVELERKLARVREQIALATERRIEQERAIERELERLGAGSDSN